MDSGQQALFRYILLWRKNQKRNKSDEKDDTTKIILILDNVRKVIFIAVNEIRVDV